MTARKADNPNDIQIVDLCVDWREGWGNNPKWEALLSAEPQYWETNRLPIWEKRGSMYRAEQGIVVHYYHWAGPGNTGGFGGSEYGLTMKDGSTVTLKGPWSSRSSCVNAEFFDRDPCTEVSYTSDPSDWRRGYTFLAGNLKVSAIIEWLRANDFQCLQCVDGSPRKEGNLVVKPIRVGWCAGNGGERFFRPLREDGTPKNPEISVEEVR
jgi:hypothetical protein